MCNLHNNNLEHKVGNTLVTVPTKNYGSSGYNPPATGNYGNGKGYVSGKSYAVPLMIFASQQYAGKNTIQYGGK